MKQHKQNKQNKQNNQHKWHKSVPLRIAVALTVAATIVVLAADREALAVDATALDAKKPLAELNPGSRLGSIKIRDLAGTERALGGEAAATDRKLTVLAFNGLGCPISELYACLLYTSPSPRDPE